MNVEELMTPNLEACRPETKLSDAAMQMWHADCGVLPVTDGNNRVLGMITDRDICMGLATQHRSPDEVSVADVMSVKVCSTTSDEEVHQAMDKMAEAKVRRLPVLDDEGKLCGIVSLNDIILRAEHKKPGSRGKTQLRGITYEDAVHTMKAVSAHWLPATVPTHNGGQKNR